MRKLFVALVVLLALVVGADRLAAHLAGSAVAARLRSTAGLALDPHVTVTGFPFLTQALAGRYDRIAVEAGGLTRGGVRLSRLHVDLLGVRLPAGQALSGRVRSVPVEGLRATVTVAYADLAHGRDGIVVRPLPGNQVAVSGRLSVLGLTVTASTRSSVTLEGRTLVVTARSLSVDGVGNPLVDRAVAGLLDLRIPLGTLPYGLRLTGVRITAAGAVVDAVSGPTVLTAR